MLIFASECKHLYSDVTKTKYHEHLMVKNGFQSSNDRFVHLFMSQMLKAADGNFGININNSFVFYLEKMS